MSTLKLVSDFHKAFKIDKEDVPFCAEEDVHFMLQTTQRLKKIARACYAQAAKGGSPATLRMQLIVEELAEVCEAIAKGDAANIIHEMADLRYVCDGAAVSMAIDDVLELAVGRVHKANMSKLDKNHEPIFNEAGRVIKSDLFKPASMKGLV